MSLVLLVSGLSGLRACTCSHLISLIRLLKQIVLGIVIIFV